MSTMEERVSRVEQILEEIAKINREIRAETLALQAERRAREEEIQAARRARDEEMQAEHQAREAERQAREAERQAREAERRAREAAMAAERRETDRRFRESDRKWGELANKMGTLVEDIVAPGIPTVFSSVFGLDRVESYAQRVRRTHRVDRGRQREFDYVASAGDLLLVNETKSTVRPEDIPAFVAALREARDYLPEAEGKRIVGALAGFSVDPSLVAAGERQGLLMFGLGTGLLRVLNTPGFRPQQF
jgi:hypothetical protein